MRSTPTRPAAHGPSSRPQRSVSGSGAGARRRWCTGGTPRTRSGSAARSIRRWPTMGSPRSSTPWPPASSSSAAPVLPGTRSDSPPPTPGRHGCSVPASRRPRSAPRQRISCSCCGAGSPPMTRRSAGTAISCGPGPCWKPRWCPERPVVPAATRAPQRRRSEAVTDQHRLVGEFDPENVPDAVPDLPGQAQQADRAGAARVDQGQRVLGRNPGPRQAGVRRTFRTALLGRVALPETGLLDEPRRGNLHVSRIGGGARDAGIGAAARSGGRLQRGELPGVQDRVDEERARAPGVRIARVEHHTLSPAQRQHRGADLPERRLLALGHAKPLRQFPVAHWPGQRVKVKPKNHIQHNEPPRVLPQPASRRDLASAALEGAGPVAEPAVPPGQLDHLAAGPVVRMDQGDGLGDLLAVGADVLDGRGPGQARDAGQALQPGQPPGHAGGHHRVPVLPRRHSHRHPAARDGVLPADPLGGHVDHRAGEAVVGDHQIASAAEDQQRPGSLVGGADLGDDLLVGPGLDDPAGRPAQPDRGELRESYLLTDLCHPWPAQARRTTARARVSTLASAERAVSASTARLPSSFSSTRALTSMVAPVSSSGTTTMEENRTPNSSTAPGSPVQSVTYRPAWAMVNMPCAITFGNPTDRAIRSFQWMTLKSPDAPQYLTRSSRVTG